jgi:hypothetical protein
MSGWNTILSVRTLEEMAAAEGFVIKPESYNYGVGNANLVGLRTPETGDALPIFARDTTIYSGTIEDCITWLRGWQKQRSYLTILFEHKRDAITRREKRLVEKRFQADVLRRIKEEKVEDTGSK